MTPQLWQIITFIVGLVLGLTVDRYHITRLSEPVDGVRHYPIAQTDRLTGHVTFCYVTKEITYTCQ